MRTWTIYMLNIENNNNNKKRIKPAGTTTTTTTKQLALCSSAVNRNSIAQGIHNWLGKNIYVYMCVRYDGHMKSFLFFLGNTPVAYRWTIWVSKGARVCVSIVWNKINDLIDLLTSHENELKMHEAEGEKGNETEWEHVNYNMKLCSVAFMNFKEKASVEFNFSPSLLFCLKSWELTVRERNFV